MARDYEPCRPTQPRVRGGRCSQSRRGRAPPDFPLPSEARQVSPRTRLAMFPIKDERETAASRITPEQIASFNPLNRGGRPVPLPFQRPPADYIVDGRLANPGGSPGSPPPAAGRSGTITSSIFKDHRTLTRTREAWQTSTDQRREPRTPPGLPSGRAGASKRSTPRHLWRRSR